MAVINLSTLRGVGVGEVSLEGAQTINKGGTNTYTISDYDSFSIYEVETTLGTASISGKDVTLTIPSSTSVKTVALTVVRDGSPKVYSIAVDAAGIITPTILSPANNSTNQSTSLTVTASAYATAPAGNGVLKKSQWQVARDTGFTDMISTGEVSTGVLTAWHVGNLPRDTVLYVRVRYESTTLGWSAWSSPNKFTTLSVMIDKPTISTTEPPYDMKETPSFQSGAFSTTPANMDSHLSSSWRVYKVGNPTPVYQLNRSMSSRYEVTIPKGVLQVSSEYQVEVKYEGSSVGESMWSDKLTFSTASSFIPDESQIGVPWEGGYYVGRINVDGTHYAIVLASAQAGGVATGLQWKTSQTTTPNTGSLYNCKANMAGAIAAGINLHPAFKFCYEYRGGGFDDWLLPSVDVLEVVYRNLKPTTQDNNTTSTGRPNGANGRNPNSIPVGAPYTTTNPSQTPLALFKQGGAESIYNSSYYWMWSSSQYSSAYAWYQYSTYGLQNLNDKTFTTYIYVRPVRLVKIN